MGENFLPPKAVKYKKSYLFWEEHIPANKNLTEVMVMMFFEKMSKIVSGSGGGTLVLTVGMALHGFFDRPSGP